MKVAITNDPDKFRITFNPMVGDHVEFDSDRQTEKGPSGGWVERVDRASDKCWIMHSDTRAPGEEFTMSAVRVLGRTRHAKTNRPLWLLQ